MSVKMPQLAHILKGLGALGNEKWLREPMRETGKRGLTLVRTYPPPPSGSGYVRTGSLYRSFRYSTTFSRDSIKLRIFSQSFTNPVTKSSDYDKWVKVREHQARIHQGRWPTDRDDAKNIENIAVDLVQAAAKKEVGKI